MLTVSRRSFGLAACACMAPEALARADELSLPAGHTSSNFAPRAGKAPLMQSRLVGGEKGARNWVAAFGKGDEVMSGLTDLIKREDIKGAHVTAIGALSSALFGWFDKDLKAYRDIPVNEQVECISLIGDVGVAEGKPALHVHGCVGHPDGRVTGGHLLRAVTWPTLEVFISEVERPLHKRKDDETSLELFDLSL
jgi:predicted DNA-binding protein with PD1-like motif